jgi:hypothetical protein
VYVETGIVAAVRGWNHERLTIDHEANMTEKTFVENAVHGIAILSAALGFADHAGARRRDLRFRHCGTNSGYA